MRRETVLGRAGVHFRWVTNKTCMGWGMEVIIRTEFNSGRTRISPVEFHKRLWNSNRTCGI